MNLRGEGIMGRRRIQQVLTAAGIAVLAVGCPEESAPSVDTSVVASAPQRGVPSGPTQERAQRSVSEQPAIDSTYENNDPAPTGLETYIAPDEIMWVPPVDSPMSYLSVRDPSGAVAQYEFAGGEFPYMNVGGLSDGLYVYEVKASPPLDNASIAAMNEIADDPDLRESMAQQLVDSGYVSDDPIAQSGSFTVASGAILPGDSLSKAALATSDQDVPSATKDQVILDDLIVDGSACIGMDCVNGESFGFDTIRLKENNLRIRFVDTSSTSSFPSRDWQLTANDSSNGGANKFSIDDIDGGRTPFTIEAGAPSHSLYVDDNGRLGLGTSTPVVDIHVKDGNTPTLRLEQDGSSGFTPQTWDVAGNEANFFIRDATNGSTLPFRIFPGAPSNALNIEASTGDVGLGTTSPDAKLDVIGGGVYIRPTDDGMAPLAELDVTSTMTTIARFESDKVDADLEIESTAADGSPKIRLVSPQITWTFGTRAGAGPFVFSTGPSLGANVAMRFNQVTLEVTVPNNLDVQGTFTNSSDKNLKDAIEPVDTGEVLQQVIDMPISTWNFKKEDESIRHLGPMAQDFMTAFGLGKDERKIAAIDADGVSLAAIQGLNAKLIAEIDKKDVMIAEQANALNALANRLTALEQKFQE